MEKVIFSENANATDFLTLFFVLNTDTNTIICYEKEELINYARKNRVSGIIIDRKTNKARIKLVPADFILIENNTLTLLKPFIVKNLLYTFSINYISELTGTSYTIVFRSKFLKNDTRVEIKKQIGTSSNVNGIFSSIEIKTDNEVLTNMDNIIDCFNKDKKDLVTILNQPLVNLTYMFKFNIVADDIDLHNVDVHNIVCVNRVFSDVKAKRVTFFSLDLSYLFSIYRPFGMRNEVRIIDFRHCYNDIKPYVEDDTLFYRVGITNNIGIYIVSKKTPMFKEVLIRDNKLKYGGILTENQANDITYLENLISKHILLGNSDKCLLYEV